MTSCPSEQALLELVDGDLADDRAIEVLDHVTACDDCATLLTRSEAALRYALGGLADAAEAAGAPDASDDPAPARKLPVRPWAAAAAVLLAAGLTWIVARPGVPRSVHEAARTDVTDAPPDRHPAPDPPPLEARVDDLLVRATRCLEPLPDAAGDLLAGLAAAEDARATIARLERVR